MDVAGNLGSQPGPHTVDLQRGAAPTGPHPPDPLLPLLGPAPVSAAIFALLVSTIALVAGACLVRPMVLIRGAFALVLLFVLRMITMTQVPLTAPPGQIALHDPIGQLFYPGSTPETRDLFFSGHTATLLLLIALVSTRRARMARPNRPWRSLFPGDRRGSPPNRIC